MTAIKNKKEYTDTEKIERIERLVSELTHLAIALNPNYVQIALDKYFAEEARKRRERRAQMC